MPKNKQVYVQDDYNSKVNWKSKNITETLIWNKFIDCEATFKVFLSNSGSKKRKI